MIRIIQSRMEEQRKEVR